MQRILDLFTPHLASKATTTGGGSREGQRLGSWFHLQTVEGELCISFKHRHKVSRLASRFHILLMGRQANNCVRIRGRYVPVSSQMGHPQNSETGYDLEITVIPRLQLNSQTAVNLPHSSSIFLNRNEEDCFRNDRVQNKAREC